jgi:ubiquinone/menaquinone biosynthesis C-methylase UbiE
LVWAYDRLQARASVGAFRSAADRVNAAATRMSRSESLLERAVPLIRLPSCRDQVPEVSRGGAGLRCPTSGTEFPYRHGMLDVLPEEGPKTLSQRSLDTAFTTWLYDRGRESALKLAGLPDFKTEVANIQTRLQVGPGDVVIDLACGHGNFTVEWARLVGSDGLVIGLDFSRSMLARAVARVAAAGVGNVLLIHGDAHDLPIASGSVRRVNCSGGFHAFPDLPRALREIARVSVPGAVLTASMFAENPAHPHPRWREWLKVKLGLHFVPLLWLGEQLATVGYEEYRWSVPKAGFGYTSAAKTLASGVSTA